MAGLLTERDRQRGVPCNRRGTRGRLSTSLGRRRRRHSSGSWCGALPAALRRPGVRHCCALQATGPRTGRAPTRKSDVVTHTHRPVTNIGKKASEIKTNQLNALGAANAASPQSPALSPALCRRPASPSAAGASVSPPRTRPRALVRASRSGTPALRPHLRVQAAKVARTRPPPTVHAAVFTSSIPSFIVYNTSTPPSCLPNHAPKARLRTHCGSRRPPACACPAALSRVARPSAVHTVHNAIRHVTSRPHTVRTHTLSHSRLHTKRHPHTYTRTERKTRWSCWTPKRTPCGARSSNSRAIAAAFVGANTWQSGATRVACSSVSSSSRRSLDALSGGGSSVAARRNSNSTARASVLSDGGRPSRCVWARAARSRNASSGCSSAGDALSARKRASAARRQAASGAASAIAKRSEQSKSDANNEDECD